MVFIEIVGGIREISFRKATQQQPAKAGGLKIGGLNRRLKTVVLNHGLPHIRAG
ncbi:MAG: hypothetical protein ACXWTS_03440 [Methylococcaceae bacterium]